jgi:GNAT superfamily N-acetyltransferase
MVLPAVPAVTARNRDEVVTGLEMTSPNELIPARPAPTPLELDEADASLHRETYVRVGAPHGWTGRTEWSDADWADELARPGVCARIARVEGDVAGLVELEAGPESDVGIVVFGLVPEYVGKGYGGELLTLATQLAWDLTAPDGTPARRVVVETSSRDHPNARRNYEARGFRPLRPSDRSV